MTLNFEVVTLEKDHVTFECLESNKLLFFDRFKVPTTFFGFIKPQLGDVWSFTNDTIPN